MKNALLFLTIALTGCNSTQIKNEPHAYYKPNVSTIEKVREGRYNLLLVGKLGESQSEAKVRWEEKAQKACHPLEYFGRMKNSYYIHLDKSFESKERTTCVPDADGSCIPITVETKNALKGGSDYPVILGEVICEKT